MTKKVKKRTHSRSTKAKNRFGGLIKPFVVVSLVAMLGMRLIVLAVYGYDVALEVFGWLDWLFLVVASVACAWWWGKAMHMSLLVHGLYGLLFGCVIGLIVALFDAVLYRTEWVVMNVWKKPLLFALVASAVIVCVATFAQASSGQNTRKNV